MERKKIYMTKFPDSSAREILDVGAQGLIRKPFLTSTLAEKLKEVMEGE